MLVMVLLVMVTIGSVMMMTGVAIVVVLCRSFRFPPLLLHLVKDPMRHVAVIFLIVFSNCYSCGCSCGILWWGRVVLVLVGAGKPGGRG